MRVISIDASDLITLILNLQVREILPEFSVRLQLWTVQRGECWGAPLETCQVTSQQSLAREIFNNTLLTGTGGPAEVIRVMKK